MTETTLLTLITDYGLSGILLYGMWHILRRNDELHKDHNDRMLDLTDSFRNDLDQERMSHEAHMRDLAEQFKNFTVEVTQSITAISNEIRLMRHDLDEINKPDKAASSA